MPLLLSMSNGKKKINIRMEGFFPPGREGEKEVPYIFFHNFTACQWKLPAIRCQLIAIGYRGWPLVVFPKGGRIKHHYFLCIINAPAGRHHNPLNLLNPVNPHVRILYRMRKSAEVGP